MKLTDSLKSIGKMLLLSKRATVKIEKAQGSVIVLANGPSLKATLRDHMPMLQRSTTMVVNFAANDDSYALLRPDYYVLVDPAFFSEEPTESVRALWKRIRATSWPLTLIVGARDLVKAEILVGANDHISIRTVNLVGVEGWGWLEALAYDKGWGMPRPRNVLIAGLMACLQMGYREVYVCGADHSWLPNVKVHENNRITTVQTHFYQERAGHQQDIDKVFEKVTMPELMMNFYIAFDSYHRMQRYALRRGISIYNATPGSYIDAFPRRALPAGE